MDDEYEIILYHDNSLGRKMKYRVQITDGYSTSPIAEGLKCGRARALKEAKRIIEADKEYKLSKKTWVFTKDGSPK